MRCNGLPAIGRLLCFCSVDEEGEIVEGEDYGTPADVKVLYIDDEAASSLPSEGLAAVPLVPKADAHDLPEPDAPIVQVEHWDDAQTERYRAFLVAHHGDAKDGGHRIGGYPTFLQSNELEYEAAIRAADEDSSFRGEAAAAARWRLLLQLESDQFMWGTDSGILYLMIHEADLAAGDFSRVVALTQGY